MRLFLSNDTTEPYALLDEEESRHCIRVLRMKAGSEVWVTSGDGTMCRARIADPHEKHCSVEIVERIADYGRRPFRLHVALAPPKNPARMEWFVEKAVEIGIDRITPLICDHSERTVQKTDRLEKIALSAMKQSLKAARPVVDPPMQFDKFMVEAAALTEDLGDSIDKLMCYCDGDERRGLADRHIVGNNALVLIGPEGDFSPHEIASALDCGFLPVTLGTCRLRTETAALYAVTALNFMQELSVHQTN